ncbi:MAG: HU family DNA-binding protein [Planctomycetota bacterium]|nr:HU family DNA-binding protein [Planctomycetota bacterium]
MAKREIVKALAVEFGMDEPTAKRVVQFVLEQIVKSLKSEGRIPITALGHYAPVQKSKSPHKTTAARLKSKIGDEGVAEARRLQEQHTPDVIRYTFAMLPKASKYCCPECGAGFSN